MFNERGGLWAWRKTTLCRMIRHEHPGLLLLCKADAVQKTYAAPRLRSTFFVNTALANTLGVGRHRTHALKWASATSVEHWRVSCLNTLLS